MRNRNGPAWASNANARYPGRRKRENSEWRANTFEDVPQPDSPSNRLCQESSPPPYQTKSFLPKKRLSASRSFCENGFHRYVKTR